MIEYENLEKFNAPFRKEFLKELDSFLDKGHYILGEQVKRFENSFAAYNGSKYCVGVASGLDALILALRVLDLPPGSEVLVPSNTYIATILSIIQNGFTPVLVEPDIATYNIDPEKIEKKITPRTKAIIVVHLYGKVCRMDKIMSIANKQGLKVIEDCAQAHGAQFNNKKAGTFGNMATFSFYPAKNLGALGDGGGIITDNVDYDAKLRQLRNYGSSVKYYNDAIGYNSRLDEIQAVFLNIKLKKLDDINNHKRKLAEIYHRQIDNKFIKPVVQAGFHDVYHIYNIRHPERDKIASHLESKGIKTMMHYPVPPHKQKAMKELLGNYSFPISEEIHKTTLSLPISYFHKEEDIEKVAEAVNNFPG